MSLPEAGCSGTDTKGFRCPNGHTCDMDYGNPENGLASFDNFGSAAMLVIGIMSTASWCVREVWALELTR